MNRGNRRKSRSCQRPAKWLFGIDRKFQQIEKLAECRHDIRFTTGNNVSHAREIPEDAVLPWGYSTRLMQNGANVSDQEVWAETHRHAKSVNESQEK